MNVNLWFARNDANEIIGVRESNKADSYTCPICSSQVIPKALNSKSVTPHYAHIDKDKCSSESMLHWWFKHKFIDRGDTFTIKTDDEYTYVCADFKVEQQFNLTTGIYRPDLIVITECGEEIVFEMANTNKKKVQDYIDRWIELDKIIVEVDIKALQEDTKIFSALYYKGKCYNFNKRDGGYYSTIGKLKEKMKQDNAYDIELVRKLDWFWREIYKYNSGESNIIYISNLIDDLLNTSYSLEKLIKQILNKNNCSKLKSDYKEYKTLDDSILLDYSYSMEYEKLGSIINNKLKNLSEKFESKIKYITVPIYETYYHGSRKYMYKTRIADKKYKIELNIYLNKRKVISIPITNRIEKIVDNKEEFVLDKLLESKLSKSKCIDCNKGFNLDKGEFKFFIKNELKFPKRCKVCRQKRKHDN